MVFIEGSEATVERERARRLVCTDDDVLKDREATQTGEGESEMT